MNYSKLIKEFSKSASWISGEDTRVPQIGDLVFVYGTLKREGWNHIRLGSSEFIATGKTEKKWVMPSRGASFPTALPVSRDDAYHISGELFRPTCARDWKSIDRLEGHPSMYRRGKISVITDSGEKVEAWMYFYLFLSDVCFHKETWVSSWKDETINHL